MFHMGKTLEKKKKKEDGGKRCKEFLLWANLET